MRVSVFGAGAIGAYVGGCLTYALDGVEDTVVLIGRESLQKAVKASDEYLELESCDLKQQKFLKANGYGKVKVGEKLAVTNDYSHLSASDVILVCTKSLQTKEAGDIIARYISESCIVLSLQNGASNPTVLREILPNNEVLGGMVGFNVVWHENGAVFRMSTDGELMLQTSEKPQFKDLIRKFRQVGFKVQVKSEIDIVSVLYSKVLVNLVNAVNTFSGKPIAATLQDKRFRKLWAASIEEALWVYEKANIKPMKIKVNPYLLPRLLRLPTVLYTTIQKLLTKVDRDAKSSMLQDMQKGKITEIDAINGEIVKLAEANEIDAPINRSIIELIREIENERLKNKSQPYKGYTSEEIYRRLKLAKV